MLKKSFISAVYTLAITSSMSLSADQVIGEHIIVDDVDLSDSDMPLSSQAAQLKIVSAQSKSIGDTLFVSAEIDCQPTAAMRKALSSGVALNLIWHLELKQDRKYLPRAKTKDFKRLFEIKFHTVTRRYIVHEKGTDFQRSFSELNSVLRYLAKIKDWRIINVNEISAERDIEMRLRASLETRSLPKPLRTVASFMGDKKLTSEWVKWQANL